MEENRQFSSISPQDGKQTEKRLIFHQDLKILSFYFQEDRRRTITSFCILDPQILCYNQRGAGSAFQQ